MSSQWTCAPMPAALHSPSLSLSFSLSLCFLSPPFRCAFINYVGFLMISALLLSRVLWPRLRLRFLLARFSFADKCTFFLASFPPAPLLPCSPSAHSLIQSKQHSYDVRLFYCSRKKQTLCCFFCLQKKRENFFTSSRGFPRRFPKGGRRGDCTLPLSIEQVWRMLHFISHLSPHFSSLFSAVSFSNYSAVNTFQSASTSSSLDSVDSKLEFFN